jgi:hypothetical protein
MCQRAGSHCCSINTGIRAGVGIWVGAPLARLPPSVFFVSQRSRVCVCAFQLVASVGVALAGRHWPTYHTVEISYKFFVRSVRIGLGASLFGGRGWPTQVNPPPFHKFPLARVLVGERRALFRLPSMRKGFARGSSSTITGGKDFSEIEHAAMHLVAV